MIMRMRDNMMTQFPLSAVRVGRPSLTSSVWHVLRRICDLNEMLWTVSLTN